MTDSIYYLLAADAVLFLHVGIVLFIVVGLLLVFIGGFSGWSWVRNPWFRATHIVAIAIVMIQSWLDVICPLTSWEMQLREKTGDEVYNGTFMSYWLHYLLYYEAPLWTFIASYTLFTVLVISAWFLVKPLPFKQKQ